MKPMLARTYGPRFDTFPCFVQPKLNGIRALFQQQPLGEGAFQSRDEKIWSPSVLAHILRELASFNFGNAILDGELYVHGWRLQRINSAIAVKRKEPTEDTLKVEYHIFDVVDPSRSFSDRFLDLYNSFPDLPHVKVVPTAMAENRQSVDFHFEQYVKLGYEGIMLRPNGPYEFGVTPHSTEKRSKFLWKYKSWTDGEFMCVATTPGEGKREGMIGALILTLDPRKKFYWNAQTRQGLNCFACGTGFSDEEATEFAKNPPVGKMTKVRWPYLSDEGKPQCPSFLMVLE